MCFLFFKRVSQLVSPMGFHSLAPESTIHWLPQLLPRLWGPSAACASGGQASRSETTRTTPPGQFDVGPTVEMDDGPTVDFCRRTYVRLPFWGHHQKRAPVDDGWTYLPPPIIQRSSDRLLHPCQSTVSPKQYLWEGPMLVHSLTAVQFKKKSAHIWLEPLTFQPWGAKS
jgi:hypothetical protein